MEEGGTVTRAMFSAEWSEGELPLHFPDGVRSFMMPFCAGSLEESRVLGRRRLTKEVEGVKEVLELELSSTDTEFSAGDTLGILCENSDSEVAQLLNLLNLSEGAHYNLTPHPEVKSRLLPKHVLLQCSPRYALKYTLDIHSLPKKALLKYLAECCERKEEAQCLFYLASKEVINFNFILLYHSKTYNVTTTTVGVYLSYSPLFDVFQRRLLI